VPQSSIAQHLRSDSGSSGRSWNDSAIAEEDEEATGGLLDERGKELVRRLKKGDKVGVGSVCGVYRVDEEAVYKLHADDT
jgi:hypothetical protein